MDLAIPVDAIDDGSSLGTVSNIIGMVWARSVGHDVQLLRLDVRNLRKTRAVVSGLLNRHNTIGVRMTCVLVSFVMLLVRGRGGQSFMPYHVLHV